MGKIKYLAKRIRNMSFDGLFGAVREVHEKTGKPKFVLFIDIVFCGLKYQAGYMDYKLYEMYNMNGRQRKTVITRGINNSIVKKYNDPEYRDLFEDKIKFNKNFSEFVGRDWVALEGENREAFYEFVAKHTEFMAKPTDLCCGAGIELVQSSEGTPDELYDRFIKNGQLLLEERLVQCDEIGRLHPDSINTIRVVTLLGKVVFAVLRIGNMHYHVDNFNHDGLCVPVDIETGYVKYKALKKTGELYEEHPVTGVKITGITIPRWDEVVKTCEGAAKKIPQVGYVGWDVCIRDNDVCLVEGNSFPGNDVYLLPAHRDKPEGLYPLFKKVIAESE